MTLSLPESVGVGDAAIINGSQSGWLFSGQMLRIRFATEFLWKPHWLVAFMLTKAFHRQIDNFAVGSTRQSLSVQLLEAIKVPIIRAEQQMEFASAVRPLWGIHRVSDGGE